MELLSKTLNTISSNVPNILIKETLFLLIYKDCTLMMPMLQLTAGSHNYNVNINRSIIQFAMKFIKDSQRFEQLNSRHNIVVRLSNGACPQAFIAIVPKAAVPR